MKTEEALREFLIGRSAANPDPTTLYWYNGRLLPFARSCPYLPPQPEPGKGFPSTRCGSPEARWCCYQALKTFSRFRNKQHGIPNLIEDICPLCRPRGEALP